MGHHFQRERETIARLIESNEQRQNRLRSRQERQAVVRSGENIEQGEARQCIWGMS